MKTWLIASPNAAASKVGAAAEMFKDSPRSVQRVVLIRFDMQLS